MEVDAVLVEGQVVCPCCMFFATPGRTCPECGVGISSYDPMEEEEDDDDYPEDES